MKRRAWAVEMRMCEPCLVWKVCDHWEPIQFCFTRDDVREMLKTWKAQKDGQEYRINRYIPEDGF